VSAAFRAVASVRVLALVLVLVLACGGCGARAPAPAARPCATATPAIAKTSALADGVASLGDTWLGDLTIAGKRERYLRVDFEGGTTRLRPELDEAPLALLRPTRAGDRIRFGIDTGKARLSFDGRRSAPDAIDGEVRAGDARGVFRLVHVAAFPPAAIDRMAAGTYAVEGDAHRLWFLESGVLFDTIDGSERRLFGLDDGRLLVGAGKSVPFPAAGTLDVIAAGAGPKRLVLHRADGTVVAASPITLASEEIRFEREGATLAGTLLVPPGPGPHPAVVNVHGSGRVTRDDFWTRAVARLFLAQGYAVLAYDKRGTGASGGEYVGRGARDTNNVSAANLERLAADARAAAGSLASRHDIDPKRIGLFGISQAGWIVPLAASRSDAIRFFVLFSGPAVHTSLESAHSSLFADGEVETRLTLDAVDRYIHEHAPRTGFDPAPSIAALHIPALWLYGALDTSIPVTESVRVLDRIAAQGKHDFTVKVFPRAGHLLSEVEKDLAAEAPYSPGMPAGEAALVRDWLAQHVGAPR
jgi:dienelactone hydrolase